MIFIAIIFLLAIFLMIMFLIIAIILFAHKQRFFGFFFIFLTLLIPFTLYMFTMTFEESTKTTSLTESEVKTALKLQNIELKKNFTLLNSSVQSDLTYFRNEFTLKISEEDYKNLHKNKIDTLKNISTKKDLTYDTIKIIVSKNKILDFYRSQHDFNN